MHQATIVIHLPVHRRETLAAYPDKSVTPEQAYDANIGRYVEFLRDNGRKKGFDVRTDQRETEPAYTIDEVGHEQKKRAHAWLEAVPDLWEWVT